MWRLVHLQVDLSFMCELINEHFDTYKLIYGPVLLIEQYEYDLLS